MISPRTALQAPRKGVRSPRNDRFFPRAALQSPSTGARAARKPPSACRRQLRAPRRHRSAPRKRSYSPRRGRLYARTVLQNHRKVLTREWARPRRPLDSVDRQIPLSFRAVDLENSVHQNRSDGEIWVGLQQHVRAGEELRAYPVNLGFTQVVTGVEACIDDVEASGMIGLDEAAGRAGKARAAEMRCLDFKP